MPHRPRIEPVRCNVSAAVFVAALAFLTTQHSNCTGSVISGDSVGDLPPTPPQDTDNGSTDLSNDVGTVDSATDGDNTDSTSNDSDGGPDVPVVPLDWKVGSLGDVGVVSTVFAVSTKEAYAVGGARVLRFNGKTWASYGDPLGETDSELRGVWSDGTTTVAVGDGGTIVRRNAGELSWTQDTSPTSADLHGVFGRGGNDIWAVGSKTTILHFDGATWTEVYTGEGLTLHAVWAPADSIGPDEVIAVGTKGRLMRHKDGTFQPQQVAAGSVTLHGITGIGEARFAVGTEATITMRQTATSTWQGQSSNDTQDRDLYGIVAASDTNVVAVGDAGAIIRYDGSKWNVELTQSPSFGAADYRSITYAGAGQSAWLVVAATGGGVQFEPQSEAWIDMPTRPEAELRHITGTDRLWAAGRNGLVMTETPEGGWTAVDSGVDLDFNDVTIDSAETIWVVGENGTVLRRTKDGQSSLLSLPVPVSLYGVAINGDQVYVGGKGGTLLSASSSDADPSFAPQASGTPSDIKSLATGGDGALWLAGAFGTLLRSEAGNTPTPIVTGVGGSLNSLAATDDGVLVAGDNGVIVRATASGAELLFEQPGLFLYGASVANSVGFVVGWNGTVFRVSGTDVSEEASGTNAVLEAVWHDGVRALATGRQGILLTRLEAP